MLSAPLRRKPWSVSCVFVILVFSFVVVVMVGPSPGGTSNVLHTLPTLPCLVLHPAWCSVCSQPQISGPHIACQVIKGCRRAVPPAVKATIPSAHFLCVRFDVVLVEGIRINRAVVTIFKQQAR